MVLRGHCLVVPSFVDCGGSCSNCNCNTPLRPYIYTYTLTPTRWSGVPPEKQNPAFFRRREATNKREVTSRVGSPQSSLNASLVFTIHELNPCHFHFHFRLPGPAPRSPPLYARTARAFSNSRPPHPGLNPLLKPQVGPVTAAAAQ